MELDQPAKTGPKSVGIPYQGISTGSHSTQLSKVLFMLVVFFLSLVINGLAFFCLVMAEEVLVLVLPLSHGSGGGDGDGGGWCLQIKLSLMTSHNTKNFVCVIKVGLMVFGNSLTCNCYLQLWSSGKRVARGFLPIKI